MACHANVERRRGHGLSTRGCHAAHALNDAVERLAPVHFFFFQKKRGQGTWKRGESSQDGQLIGAAY